jgi:hypothetical protein
MANPIIIRMRIDQETVEFEVPRPGPRQNVIDLGDAFDTNLWGGHVRHPDCKPEWKTENHGTATSD